MADQLGQRDVIIVFDQAIYAKALEIVWQNPQQFQRVVLRMGTFHTERRSPELELFWNSYLEMVATLLSLIRATREGNWELHLEGIKAVLPWFFAYDHTYYARIY